MIETLGIVLLVILCTGLAIFGIGAVFLNLFDHLDDERPEEEV